MYDFRHVAFMFENLTAVNETNSSISLHVRKNDTSFLNQDPFKQDIFAEARQKTSERSNGVAKASGRREGRRRSRWWRRAASSG